MTGPVKPTATNTGWCGAVAAGLALLAGAPGTASADSDFFEFRGFRAEASYTSDDNVTRAPASDALRDSALGVRVSAGGVIPISMRTRASVQGFAGAQKFNNHTGLSNNFIGTQGDFFFRSSGEFGAATYGAFIRTAKEEYESTLRDGYRHAFGVTWLKPATDKIQLSAGVTYNITDGKSIVFDTKNVSLRGTADWSLGRWDTVYVGAEYRRGDSVSTSPQSLAAVNVADAIVPDDAFDDTRFAYRFKASALLATLGYNRAFGESQSLDVSWRRVQSMPLHPPGNAPASELRYVVNQISVAYLARF